MDPFYLTTTALPRLSLLVLTVGVFAYFVSRIRRSPGTGWLALALGGFALHHAAFNAANALGPFLAGSAIAAGYGWTAPGWVGSLLALGGLAVLLTSFWVERRRRGGWQEAEPCST